MTSTTHTATWLRSTALALVVLAAGCFDSRTTVSDDERGSPPAPGTDASGSATDGEGPGRDGGGAPDDREVAETQVWVGTVATESNTFCKTPVEGDEVEGPPVHSEYTKVVLVIDVDSEGYAMAASMLFGDATPPEDPTDAWSHQWVRDCQVAPMMGFGYAMREVVDEGMRLRLRFSALDVYRQWCARQTPIEIPLQAADSVAVTHTCRPWMAWLPPDSSVPQQLCVSNTDDMACRCTAAGCQIDPVPIEADLLRDGVTMDGVISLLSGTGHSTRMLLERAE